MSYYQDAGGVPGQGLPPALRSGGPRWNDLTAPASEPLTVAEAKLALRISHDDDDATVARLITAARQKIEKDANHLFVTRQVVITRDGWRWPNVETASDILYILPGPVTVVDDVQYVTGGTLTSLASTGYQHDLARIPARLAPAQGKRWPVTDPVLNAVQITITAGYATAAVIPQALQQALYLLIGHWYENRLPLQQDGREPIEVPMGYQYLINTFTRGVEIL